MGRRELGMKKLEIKKFDLGFFPNKDFEDVPEGGSPDCRHVLYRRSALRPFPGMDLINSSKAGFLLGQGLHYLDVDGGTRRLAVFGEALYGESGGTLSDITGTATIGNGNRVQFVDHQEGSNQWAIGVQGNGGSPFRVGVTGSAQVLGGSPPAFETIAKYHNTFFGSVGELNYFSATADPETWNTGTWVFQFEKNITCQLEHGPKLAVMMADHIGSVQGYDYLDLNEEEREISKFGCVGKHAAKNCHWGNGDLKVIATIAKDGLYVFDQSFSFNKVLGDDYFNEFNQSQLSKASMAYWQAENLLFLALPYAASTEPNYLIIVNMKTGAFWPGPDLHGNFIRDLSSMRDVNGDEFIYFQDTNGYAYKFNMDSISYHSGTETESIDYKWKSRRYDLDAVHSFGEAVMLADAVGNWGTNLSIQFGLGEGDGTAGTITFGDDHDLIGSTFVLGASTLGGSRYVFKPLVGIGGFGRFLQVTITPQGTEGNDLLGSSFILGTSALGSAQSFRTRRIEVHLHDHRRGGNDQ